MRAAAGTQQLPLSLPDSARQRPIHIGKALFLAAEGDLQVVFFRSLAGDRPLYHFRDDDLPGRYLIVVDLVRHHGIQVTRVARVFGLHRVTLHEKLNRFEAEGLSGLFPRERHRTPSKIKQAVERRLLELKRQGVGHSEAARRLGVTESGVRRALRRLGWSEPVVVVNMLPLVGTPPPVAAGSSDTNEAVAAAPSVTVPCSAGEQIRPAMVESTVPEAPGVPATESEPVITSTDADPLNRAGDRLMAKLGLLSDAAPLFAPGTDIPRAGVLLAVPVLATSKVFDIARAVYGSIGPAFYGLRTSVLAFLLLALLRIKRAENLKEVDPVSLGRILGLDRAPEMKTLRRKLQEMADRARGLEFMRANARAQAEDQEETLAFLYVDGHVRVYSGDKKLPKTYVMQRRLAMPATTDYWVNTSDGQPLLVVTAEANEGLAKMLVPVLKEVREAIGDRRPTVVFDRGGWSPKLFRTLINEMGCDVLTYRKGKVAGVSRRAFSEHKATFDGREVTYELADKRVRLLNGKLRMRQVTCLGKNDYQTHILTNRMDLSAIEVAHRMFERWRQENFFKYMEEEYGLDALVDYGDEPADPDRTVPNPQRRAIERELKLARQELAKLEREYGAKAFENKEEDRRTMRGFKIANGTAIGKPLREARAKVREIEERRKAVPVRVPVRQALGGEDPIRLRRERKRLADTFKIVAYQAETALFNLLRPHYTRTDEDGRTLIVTALQSPADISVADGELRVTIAPLSAPHRTRAIQGLCAELNGWRVPFPGTDLVLQFAVREAKV